MDIDISNLMKSVAKLEAQMKGCEASFVKLQESVASINTWLDKEVVRRHKELEATNNELEQIYADLANLTNPINQKDLTYGPIKPYARKAK